MKMNSNNNTRFVFLEIRIDERLGDDEESLRWSRYGAAINRILAHAEDMGRAKFDSYCCEGPPEQMRNNPPCVIGIAALTRCEQTRLLDLRNRAPENIEIAYTESDEEHSYGGTISELPIFNR
jgi:hypothetical protein